jgi:hypothetical protein
MSARCLPELWMAPEGLPFADVGRPVQCLSTTYTFDAGYFETQLLSRFLGLRYDETDDHHRNIAEREQILGVVPVAVLVDRRQASDSQSTLRWDQIPIAPPSGIQHAKVSVLVWERVIRVIVGSANLTKPGYRSNREIMAALDFLDHERSLPRALLLSILTFLGKMGEMAVCAAPSQQRVGEQIVATRRLAKKWTAMPDDFAPSARPQVQFIPGLPKLGGRPAERVLDRTLEIWGKRKIWDATVVTPFVDYAPNAQLKLLQRLSTVSGLTASSTTIVLPCKLLDPRIPQLEMVAPASFAGAVEAVMPGYAWEHGVLQDDEDDADRRVLHAKALWLRGQTTHLMLVGSSNFTSRGMGTGTPNVEANLCYLDDRDVRDDTHWLHRWPFEWTATQIDSEAQLTWQENPNADDPAMDEATGAMLPRFFRAATIKAGWASEGAVPTGSIVFTFDGAETAPSAWRILLPSGTDSAMLLEGDSLWNDEYWTATIPDAVHPSRVRVLRVEWTAIGETCSALWPVSLADVTDLPLSEDASDLSADEILACLITGRSPARVAASRIGAMPADASSNVILDPLRSVRTDGYLLYRTRRLGRALTYAGARIEQTPPRPAAMRFRLETDPTGLVELARALCRQQRADEAKRSDVSPVQGCVFALAEILLLLGYAGKSAQARASADGLRVLPEFRHAASRVYEMAHVAQERRDPGADIRTYLEDCRIRVSILLGADIGEESGGSHAV